MRIVFQLSGWIGQKCAKDVWHLGSQSQLKNSSGLIKLTREFLSRKITLA